MKKLVAILMAILLAAGLSAMAYAQESPAADIDYAQESPTADVDHTQESPTADVDDEQAEYEEAQHYAEDERISAEELKAAQRNAELKAANGEPLTDEELIDAQRREDGEFERLSDGEAGRGTILAPDKYWAANGYPDNISFAYEAGGEGRSDGTIISWWEIGIVNADAAAKQEILDMLSPNCRVTFRDCTYSYAQREAAYNDIRANLNDIVRDVQMLRNTECVLVVIADGYEKEYAHKYIEQYGPFVAVTSEGSDGMDCMDDADTGGNSGGILTDRNGTDLSAERAAADGVLEMGGVFDDTLLIGANNVKMIKSVGGSAWLWVICAILLVIAATVAYLNRARFFPALQTNAGSTVTSNAPLTRKQTITAVKTSAKTPPCDLFESIMEKVDNTR